MSSRSFEVEVNPAVLKWARESVGLESKDAAKKLKIEIEDVNALESGSIKPRLSQLKKLSILYKRPLAVFLLPEPPKEYLPKDFRIIPGNLPPKLSKESRLAIRKALRLQSIAKELMQVMGLDPTIKLPKIDLNTDPESLAIKERERLDIQFSKQQSWKNTYEAFREWRKILENLYILVFRLKIPTNEARGFSLLNGGPATIVVSGSDSINARVFTLFHEYAHLLLEKAGICLPDIVYGKQNLDDWRIEAFCNQFAGAFLVPENILKEDTEVKRIIKTNQIPEDDSLEQISRKFKVSKEVILRRLLSTNIISENQFKAKLIEWENIKPIFRSEKEGGFQRPPEKVLSERGSLFVSLVLEARENGIINYADVADFLSIRLKHFDKLESLFIKAESLS
ncbi:MAG: ImmA/IrrE family metallo-endopeptidase [Actinobacteria bacterium]|nr:ImmA/IrrE family metallo-endopeptidase [Actinomycetota bacterium]